MLELVITPAELVYKPGLRIIAREIPLDYQNEVRERFVQYIAESYVQDVVDAIETQRYKRYWIPLNERYLDSKRRAGLSIKIWESTGTLKRSIRVVKRGQNWHIGISDRKRYPGTRVSVAQVAQWIEFGTSRMPARPLFRPLIRYYKRNIRTFWELFLLEEAYDYGEFQQSDE